MGRAAWLHHLSTRSALRTTALHAAGQAAARVRGMARHVGGMRTSLLDATYGLDLALPGTAGFGRLVAWYAPARREGMLELRLF